MRHIVNVRGIFIFSQATTDETKNAEVGGNLKVLIESLPALQVDGNANVILTEEEEMGTRNLSVSFWGDAIIRDSVSSFEDAVRVFKKELE